jgi:hypothetical protein
MGGHTHTHTLEVIITHTSSIKHTHTHTTIPSLSLSLSQSTQNQTHHHTHTQNCLTHISTKQNMRNVFDVASVVTVPKDLGVSSVTSSSNSRVYIGMTNGTLMVYALRRRDGDVRISLRSRVYDNDFVSFCVRYIIISQTQTNTHTRTQFMCYTLLILYIRARSCQYFCTVFLRISLSRVYDNDFESFSHVCTISSHTHIHAQLIISTLCTYA